MASRTRPPKSAAPAPTASRAKPGAVRIRPGETRAVLKSTSSRSLSRSVCVWATQEESTDDGGSQSPLGFIDFGAPGRMARVEFDVREGAVLCVPAQNVVVSALNRNEEGGSDILVTAFLADGMARGANTRSVDIGGEMPNVRVPAFADAVRVDAPALGADQWLYFSDSATGEDYGAIPPGLVLPIHHRARWICLRGVEAGLFGVVTFFLSV